MSSTAVNAFPPLVYAWLVARTKIGIRSLKDKRASGEVCSSVPAQARFERSSAKREKNAANPEAWAPLDTPESMLGSDWG
jgi:hypothetical protein